MAVVSSNIPWPYIPSRHEIETNRAYKDTRKHYGYDLDNQRHLPLEKLRFIPAPIVCPCCDKSVITTVISERTAHEKFNLALSAILTLGIMAIVASGFKTLVHVCPSCHSRIASIYNAPLATIDILQDYPNGHPNKEKWHQATMGASYYYVSNYADNRQVHGGIANNTSSYADNRQVHGGTTNNTGSYTYNGPVNGGIANNTGSGTTYMNSGSAAQRTNNQNGTNNRQYNGDIHGYHET